MNVTARGPGTNSSMLDSSYSRSGFHGLLRGSIAASSASVKPSPGLAGEGGGASPSTTTSFL